MSTETNKWQASQTKREHQPVKKLEGDSSPLAPWTTSSVVQNALQRGINIITFKFPAYPNVSSAEVKEVESGEIWVIFIDKAFATPSFIPRHELDNPELGTRNYRDPQAVVNTAILIGALELGYAGPDFPISLYRGQPYNSDEILFARTEAEDYYTTEIYGIPEPTRKGNAMRKNLWIWAAMHLITDENIAQARILAEQLTKDYSMYSLEEREQIIAEKTITIAAEELNLPRSLVETYIGLPEEKRKIEDKFEI